MTKKTTGTITIRTDLLVAVARWAHHDAARPIGAVVFRDGTVTATDAHRLVVVPHETNGQAFGVTRNHLLAAAAAQDLMAREDMDPQVGHDLVDAGGDVTLADGPQGERTIDLWADGASVAIRIGALQIVAPRIDHRSYPAAAGIEKILAQGDDSPSPDGFLLDARYLAAVADINTASASYRDGVRVTRWGKLYKDGTRTPVTLENINGVRFAIMPHRETGRGWGS